MLWRTFKPCLEKKIFFSLEDIDFGVKWLAEGKG